MELELERLNKSPLRRSHKERINLLRDLFEVDNTEESIYKVYPFGENRAYCLGTIIIGENNLTYYRYLAEPAHQEFEINELLLENVDNILYETPNHLYKTTRIRALEFKKDKINFVNANIPLVAWEVRPTDKVVPGGILKMDSTEERRRNLIGDSWYTKMKDVLKSEYMTKLGNFIRSERQVKQIYPDEEDVFKAYRLSIFEHTKVIILGKNPYYTPNTADGLAFSFKNGLKQPNQKALDIIHEEIQDDIYNGFDPDRDDNLMYLANQGVLLLNSSLTVERSKPESHLDIGWDRFIKISLWELMKDDSPKVFMAWGRNAQNLIFEVAAKFDYKPGNGLFNSKFPHLILTAPHPAYDVRLRNSGELPLDNQVRYPTTFRGCHHFSQANKFLQEYKGNGQFKKPNLPIEW